MWKQPLASNWFALFFFLFFVVWSQVSGMLLGWFYPAGAPTFVSSCVTYLLFAVCIALYLSVTKKKLRDLGFQPLDSLDLLRGAGIGFLCQPFAMLLSYLGSFIFFDPLQNLVSSFDTAKVPPLLSMALLPALFEETICRGIVLYDGYRKTTPLWAKLLFPALIFAIIHGNLEQFLYAFPMGVVLGGLLLCSDSIWPGIMAHFTLNASQILISFFQVSKTTTYFRPAFDWYTVILLLIGTVLAAPFIFLMMRGLLRSARERWQTSASSAELLNPSAPVKSIPKGSMGPMIVFLILGFGLMISSEIMMH